MIRKTTLLTLLLIATLGISAQEDSIMIRKFFDEEMMNGDAYKNLYTLCKTYPHRLSGSKGLEGAIIHSYALMHEYGFDTVYLQKVMVPHWERGSGANIKGLRNGSQWQMDGCALGGSIATPQSGIQAPMEIIRSEAEWKIKGESGLLRDKIVFVNIGMDQRTINAFKAYGACWNVRGTSAIRAASYGAKGVVIRSLSQTINKFPHTGMMYYSDTVEQIPAMAISTEHAEILAADFDRYRDNVTFFQDCKTLDDAESFNVIAEIKARIPTNRYITIGGHLDCWDMGEGAHDDGAGIMHCLDAALLLKKYYKPNNNIRCVFFTNEENGNNGGKEYARQAKLNNETQVYALESDVGGFVPRGIGMDMKDEEIETFQQLIHLLRPYYMDYLEPHGGGVDIGPMKKYGTILSYLIIDSQRYFDVHHSDNDIVENVNERELKLGAAGIASWVYLMDKHIFDEKN